MDFLFIFLLPILSFSIVTMLAGNYFEAAGLDKKKARIPVYNVFMWFKIIQRKPYWGILYIIPYVNAILILWKMTEILKRFGYMKLWQQLLVMLFGYIYIPYLNFTAKLNYLDREKYLKARSRRKDGAGGVLLDWTEALIFAVLAATIIRAFIIEAYTIPTPSMENTLLVGDYLFVSKFHYGPRVPNSPLAIPFTHHTVGLTGTKAYADHPHFGYHRLPGFASVQKNDKVVFNYPMETFRPVDKRENYIKRCVAVAGDTLEIRDQEWYINGDKQENPKGMKVEYMVYYNEALQNNLSQYTISLSQGQITQAQNFARVYRNQFNALLDLNINIEDIKPAHPGLDYFSLPKYNDDIQDELTALAFIDSIKPVTRPAGQPNIMFPFYKAPFTRKEGLYEWNLDNFGPLAIPKKGQTVAITKDNYYLYDRIIAIYENDDAFRWEKGQEPHLEVRAGKVYFQGEEITEYTFKMDYYFMMGDNRHNSLDSRYWGFVPEDHVLGKAWFIWLSLDKNRGLFSGKIRFNRMFRMQ